MVQAACRETENEFSKLKKIELSNNTQFSLPRLFSLYSNVILRELCWKEIYYWRIPSSKLILSADDSAEEMTRMETVGNLRKCKRNGNKHEKKKTRYIVVTKRNIARYEIYRTKSNEFDYQINTPVGECTWTQCLRITDYKKSTKYPLT